MSPHGPMYPTADLSLAEMPPFHKGLCSMPQPGVRPALKTGVKTDAQSQSSASRTGANAPDTKATARSADPAGRTGHQLKLMI